MAWRLSDPRLSPRGGVLAGRCGCAAAEFRGCLGRLLSAATQQELAQLLQKAGQEGLSGQERERLAILQRTVVADGSAHQSGQQS